MIISIQSHVVFGHVGNRAAVFPLERMGVEVLPLNTVQFSNHPGYGSWKGSFFPGSHIAEIWQGIVDIGAADRCDAVLSGYIGSSEVGRAIVDIVESLRKAGKPGVFCCDPVMGDYEEGLYVKPDIPSFYAHEALPRASIVKPNQFEAELLSGIPIRSLSSARQACSILHDKGPGIVLITSVDALDGSDGSICSILSLRDKNTGNEKGYSIKSPRFNFAVPPHGAGDLTCALFLGYYLESTDPCVAFERTMTAVHKVFEHTNASQGRELEIVASQDAFALRDVQFPCSCLW